MAKFLVTHQEIGRMGEDEKRTVVFHYEGDLLLVSDIEVSCGCTVAEPDYANKQIRASYTSPILSFHPQTKEIIKEQDTTKSITLNEITGQTVLTFRSVTVKPEPVKP